MRISDWSSDVCSSDLSWRLSQTGESSMNEALRDLGEYLEATIGGDVLAVEIAHDQLNLIVARSAVAKVLTLLRDDQNCQFKQHVELTAVDRPDQAERFEVVYKLLSLKLNQRPDRRRGGKE